jgi:hypothetical protein
LRQADGFVATELQCETLDDGRYRVRDFWRSHRGFESFRERFADDFAEFDRRIVDELVEKQEFVGAYYESDDDLRV